MTLNEKIKKIEKLGEHAHELIELSEGFLSIRGALEMTSGPNFEKLLDSHIAECVKAISEALYDISR